LKKYLFCALNNPKIFILFTKFITVFYFLLISIYLSPGLPYRTSKQQEMSSSLKREHPALQNIKFLHVCGSVLPSWIRIQPTKKNADPDPHHCKHFFETLKPNSQ
jgi:hypothetical protein